MVIGGLITASIPNRGRTTFLKCLILRSKKILLGMPIMRRTRHASSHVLDVICLVTILIIFVVPVLGRRYHPSPVFKMIDRFLQTYCYHVRALSYDSP